MIRIRFDGLAVASQPGLRPDTPLRLRGEPIAPGGAGSSAAKASCGFDAPTAPHIYLPAFQGPPYASVLFLRTHASPGTLGDQIDGGSSDSAIKEKIIRRIENRLELGGVTRPPAAPTFVFDRHH